MGCVNPLKMLRYVEGIWLDHGEWLVKNQLGLGKEFSLSLSKTFGVAMERESLGNDKDKT